MKNIKILGIGKSIPNKKVLSSDIDISLNLSVGSVEKITGLERRFFLDETDSVENLLNKSINEAVLEANLNIDDIDCIINASATMIQSIPYNGAYINKIQKPNKPIPSFDINMTCLSVLRAFDISANLFDSYKRILIVSCDIASVALDLSNIKTAGIFGDGATAMIVEKSETGGIIHSKFETYYEGYDFCQIKGGGHNINPRIDNYANNCFFEMNGKKLYKLTTTILPNFIQNSLKEINLSIADIDWIVPHQASQAALEHIRRILNINENKFINIFKENGNQVSSSIPSAMHYLIHNKEIKSKQKILITGTSAGLGLGLVVWEVP